MFRWNGRGAAKSWPEKTRWRIETVSLGGKSKWVTDRREKKKPRGQAAGKSSLWECQGWTVSKGSQIFPEIRGGIVGQLLTAIWEGRLRGERPHFYVSEYQKCEQKNPTIWMNYTLLKLRMSYYFNKWHWCMHTVTAPIQVIPLKSAIETSEFELYRWADSTSDSLPSEQILRYLHIGKHSTPSFWNLILCGPRGGEEKRQ